MKNTLKERETVARKYEAINDCLTGKGKGFGLPQNRFLTVMEVFYLLAKLPTLPGLLFTEDSKKSKKKSKTRKYRQGKELENLEGEERKPLKNKMNCLML